MSDSKFGLPEQPSALEWWGARALVKGPEYEPRRNSRLKRNVMVKVHNGYVDFLADRISIRSVEGNEGLSPIFVKTLKGTIGEWIQKEGPKLRDEARTQSDFPLSDGTILRCEIRRASGYLYCGVSRMPAEAERTPPPQIRQAQPRRQQPSLRP